MHFVLKLITALIILAISLIGGLFPILVRINERTQRWLIYGEAFAGGIFLGAGFIHLLPDAQHYFSLADVNYPWVFAICALTIWLLHAIEEAAFHLLHKPMDVSQDWLAYLLILVLSIHAVIVGTAFGVETTLAGMLVIFIAIVSHKASEAFALGVNMRKSHMHRKTALKSMGLFSLMTPIGIFIGSSLIPFLQAQSGYIIMGTFNAIASGTFIYIATFHSVSCKHVGESARVSVMTEIICIALGLALMALVAIWI